MTEDEFNAVKDAGRDLGLAMGLAKRLYGTDLFEQEKMREAKRAVEKLRKKLVEFKEGGYRK